MESVPSFVTVEEKSKAFAGVTYETKRLIDVICSLDLDKLKGSSYEAGFDTLYDGYLNRVRVTTTEGSGSGFDAGCESSPKAAFVQKNETVENVVHSNVNYLHYEKSVSDIYKNCRDNQYVNNENLVTEKIIFSLCKNSVVQRSVILLDYISHLKNTGSRIETIEPLTAPKTFKENYFYPGKNMLNDLFELLGGDLREQNQISN
jgi:hypothetical protein